MKRGEMPFSIDNEIMNMTLTLHGSGQFFNNTEITLWKLLSN